MKLLKIILFAAIITLTLIRVGPVTAQAQERRASKDSFKYLITTETQQEIFLVGGRYLSH